MSSNSSMLRRNTSTPPSLSTVMSSKPTATSVVIRVPYLLVCCPATSLAHEWLWRAVPVGRDEVRELLAVERVEFEDLAPRDGSDGPRVIGAGRHDRVGAVIAAKVFQA